MERSLEPADTGTLEQHRASAAPTSHNKTERSARFDNTKTRSDPSYPWNNGKEAHRWEVAEIQKMSPQTTGRCYQNML